jgi:26S proteasome non-ATPase regulatory subunit 10
MELTLERALIEGGADRQRTNPDGQRPEELTTLGDTEGRRLKQFIVSRVGPLP